MANWSRVIWWSHALGVAGFYTFLWFRTRPKQSAPLTSPDERNSSLPAVSVIVPARNEEETIQRCVISLLEQVYPAYEVIVVDDDSTDRTPLLLDEIARTHPQGAHLRVIHLRGLPTGWAGKPHALHAGAQEARGDFLLFTDADTWHAPQALATAVTRAEEKRLDLLSLGTTQELPSFWERVMMPMAHLGISMQYPPDQVNDPDSPLALANGQYILLRQTVYERLGGYARPDLRATLLDDRDLAMLVKKQGYALEMADGRGLVHVRMYSNLRETWRGWRKNVFLGSRGGLPFVLLQMLGLPMVAIVPFLLPLWCWLASLTGRKPRAGEAALISTLELGPLLIYRNWLNRELRVPWYYALTHPLAGLLFTGILAQSTWRILTGRGVDWSGRNYFQKARK